MNHVTNLTKCKETGEKELARLKAELISILESATEQQKKCYLGETNDNSVPLHKLIAFREKQIEAMKISTGLKILMNNK